MMTVFFLKTSLILLVAIVATALMRRSSAASRHVVWSCALLAVLCLPIASALVPALPLPWLPSAPLSADFAVTQAAQLPEREIFEAVPAPSFRDPSPTARGTKRAAPAVPTRPARSWPWLGFLWGAGAVVVLSRLVAGFWRRAALARRCDALADSPLRDVVRGYASAMGIARRVRILVAPAEMMPATWGLVRPTVLLPPSAHHWENDRLRLVLVHELSHVIRFDTLTAAIAYFATALAWWNPLVWFAARRAQLERERACDDAVLRSGLAPSRYAGELLAIARTLPSPFAQRLALAMARPRGIERRIDAILDGRQRRTVTSHTVAVATSVLLAAQWPLAAVQLVSAPPPPSTAPSGTTSIVDATFPVTAAFTSSVDVVARRPQAPQHQDAERRASTSQSGPQPIAAGNFGAGAYRPGNGVTNPIRIREVKPVYTREAERAGVQGTVELEAVVDADGAVTAVRVVRSLDAAMGLDASALEAVRNTPFVPCKIKDQTVPCLVVFELQYKLDPPAQIPVGQFGAGAYIFRQAAGMEAPVRIRDVRPQYTPDAMRAKIQGVVTLEFVINADGTVGDVSVYRSLDRAFGLDEQAIKAAKAMRWQPGTLKGAPVAMVAVCDITFTLR